MLNHQFSEPFTIDKYNSLWQVFYKLFGLSRKLRSSDKHSFSGTITNQAPEEGLNFWPADVIAFRIPFSLNIHSIQTQQIFIDDSINSTVIWFAKAGGGITPRTAVSHFHQEIDDETLEESWRVLQDPFNQITCERCIQCTNSDVYLFFRRDCFDLNNLLSAPVT